MNCAKTLRIFAGAAVLLCGIAPIYAARAAQPPQDNDQT